MSSTEEPQNTTAKTRIEISHSFIYLTSAEEPPAQVTWPDIFMSQSALIEKVLVILLIKG